MTNFLLIGLCILAGLLVKRFTKLPPDAYKGVNAWIINLALPAVSFKYLPHVQWSKNLLLPALMPVIIWLSGWCYIRAYAHAAKLDKRTEAGLKITTGLSNTSFVGFPLILAYFNEQALGVAVICDQVTFLLLSTAGIIVALNASEGSSLSAGAVINKVLKFPPFIACITALILPRFINISMLDPLFDKLAGTVGPLALFSIGLQMKFEGWKGEIRHLSVSLLYKLVIAPLIICVIVVIVGMKGVIADISIFEAAMPSFLTAGIVAAEYNLNPKLSSLVVGISIFLSFISTAAWYSIIIALQ